MLKELELQGNGVLTWLHLSDIHMNKSEVEQKPVLRKLTEDVKHCREEFDLNPDLVFLTGDISQKGLKSQYDAAKVFLDNVGKASGIESDRIFLIPGNHDVDRKKIKSLSMSLLQEYLLEKGSTNNEEIIKLFLFDEEHRKDREALLFKHDAYVKFITSNYPHCSPFGPPYYSVAGFNLPSGPNPERLWIVCLNTAWLGREGESENRLILGRHQIIHALDSVEDKGDSDNDIIVTLTHHPLSWLINWDEDFCKQIIEHQCDFHLCGHLHLPMLNFGGMVGPQRCSEIQAGAAYGSDQWYNGYNFVRLDFKSKKGRIYLRRFEPTLGGKWTPDIRFTKPEYGQFEWDFRNRFLRKPSRPAKAISKPTPPVTKPAPSLDSLLMEGGTWEGLMHRIDLARNSSTESKKIPHNCPPGCDFRSKTGCILSPKSHFLPGRDEGN